MTLIPDIILIVIELVLILLLLLVNRKFNNYMNQIDNMSSFKKISNLRDISPQEIAFIIYNNENSLFKYVRLFETSVALLFSNDLIKIEGNKFIQSMNTEKNTDNISLYSKFILELFSKTEANTLTEIIKKNRDKATRHRALIPDSLKEKGILVDSALLLIWYVVIFFITAIIIIIANFFSFVAIVGYGIILTLLIFSGKKTDFKDYILTKNGKRIKNQLIKMLNNLKHDFETSMINKDKVAHYIYDLKSNLAYYLLIPFTLPIIKYDRIKFKNWIHSFIVSDLKDLENNIDLLLEELNRIFNFLENLKFVSFYLIPKKIHYGGG